MVLSTGRWQITQKLDTCPSKQDQQRRDVQDNSNRCHIWPDKKPDGSGSAMSEDRKNQKNYPSGKRNIAGDQRTHGVGQLKKRWKIGDGLGHGTADVSRQAETEVLGEGLMFLRNEED